MITVCRYTWNGRHFNSKRSLVAALKKAGFRLVVYSPRRLGIVPAVVVHHRG